MLVHKRKEYRVTESYIKHTATSSYRRELIKNHFKFQSKGLCDPFRGTKDKWKKFMEFLSLFINLKHFILSHAIFFSYSFQK